MTKTRNRRAFRIAAAVGIASGVGIGTQANAAFIPLPIVSGSAWTAQCFGSGLGEGSCGSTPIAAYSPYPDGPGKPDPTTTTGHIMWYWDSSSIHNPTANPTRANGPHGPIVFSYNFNLPKAPGPDDQYGAWIGADDFMYLAVNGSQIATYILVDHKSANTMPVLEFVDFTSLLHIGSNRFEITACDGFFPTCEDHGYEWAFFDASTGPDKPARWKLRASGSIPEPSSMSLLSFAALAGWLFRKRPFQRSRHKTA